MEIEIMMTGIGGQGVQLIAQTLARAATIEDRDVMLLGTYGGMMRGGNTDSTMVIADQPVSSPPMLSKIGVAMAMHHEFWDNLEVRLRPGAVVVLNDSVFVGDVTEKDVTIHRIPATKIANDLKLPMGAAMVFLGAYAKLSGIVSLSSLVAAMTECLPSYRTQHIESNTKALTAGYESIDAGLSPAWVEKAA